jgi:deoxyribonucleoside regulator
MKATEDVHEQTLGRERMAVELARRHYLDDESMSDLATVFGISRSTVSRLITLAHERHWVRITIVDPDHHETESARYLRERFDLHSVVAVAQGATADVVDAVGRRAAELLLATIEDHQTVGVAWGTTTRAVAAWLGPTDRVGCTVVQLNGAGSPEDLAVDYSMHILGQFSSAWNATVVYFPVPAFFDSADTRTALWKERSIRRVLRAQRSCDVAVFSVGSTNAQPPSRVYAAGYLSTAERRQLQADGAVGDVATHFYDGTGRTDRIHMNARASGIRPDALRKIPERCCVAAGVGKTEALAGALRGGYVTTLIADTALIDSAAAACRAD